MTEKQQIFVVDDDDIFLMIATANLQNICGDIEIVTATNGEQALSLLSTTHPSVMLLDINMPVMDGWELLDRLEQANEYPAIINNLDIFITTSSVDPGDKRKAVEHPLVRGFIEKPLSMEKIKELRIC